MQRRDLKRDTFGLAASLAAAVVLLASCSGCQSVPPGGAEAQADPFVTDRVVEVRIVMSQERWQETVDNAMAEQYVKADLWYDGELIPDIAVRPKGNSSLMTTVRSGSERMGLKVDFNFFNSARTLHGIKKVNFNNGFSDPTFLREHLAYELFEAMGIPTPRSSFADLWVNDTHLGLYTMVEQVDRTFLDRNFACSTGNLYKPEMPACYLDWTEEDLAGQESVQVSGEDTEELINLGGGKLAEIMEAFEAEQPASHDAEAQSSLPEEQGDTVPAHPATPPAGMFPPDPAAGEIPVRPPGFARGNMMGPGGTGRGDDLLQQMGLKTNENSPDHDLLFRFLDILNNEPDETFPQEIEKVLDVDETLRFLAVSALIVHLDNYIGMGHNYYLYNNNSKFVVIPWDLNMAFGTFNSGLDLDGLVNFYIDEPTSGEVAQRPLVARLLAHEPYLETYHSYLDELLDGPFDIEHMNRRISQLATMVRPYVAADELKFFTEAQFEAGIESEGLQRSGFNSAPGLKPFIAARHVSVSEQLDGKRQSSSSDGSGNGGTFGPGGFNRTGGEQEAIP